MKKHEKRLAQMQEAEKISTALGETDEALLIETNEIRTEENRQQDEQRRGIRQKSIRRFAAGAAACLCIGGLGTAAVSLLIGGMPLQTYAAAEAAYPQQVQYPSLLGQLMETKAEEAWREQNRFRHTCAENKTGTLWTFTEQSTAALFADVGTENRVCSPVSLYMALCMLSEITDGESRAQIINLLGNSDIETIREEANAVWNANYCDDGTVRSLIANSIWLDDHISYDSTVLQSLADNYYASSYHGDMGSKGFDQALQKWLTAQTDGLLKKYTDTATFQPFPENVMTLLSTVSYAAKWDEKFSKDQTITETFHALTGDVLCDFMHKKKNDRSYYWADAYAAISLSFEYGGTMWIILPDEGITPSEVIEEGTLWQMIADPYTYEQSKYLYVNIAVPKFDITSSIDAKDTLQSLGMTDVFDVSAADFSLLAENSSISPVWISAVEHTARIVMDEDGCTATAFTRLPGAGAPMPPDEEVDFICNRPFLFVLTGEENTPLFVGVVNQP